MQRTWRKYSKNEIIKEEHSIIWISENMVSKLVSEGIDCVEKIKQKLVCIQ